MTTPSNDQTTSPAGHSARMLLHGLPVTERRLDLAGITTAVLEGGGGPPIILLHGPGESAVNWRWVIPELVATRRIVAPDLPAHGGSEAPDGPPDAERVIAWLSDLIDATCSSAPAVVGHVLGGAIAARFAAARGAELDRLVLVDTLGIARFRPSPGFALSFIGFQMRPTERTYTRFMQQCAYDLDALRADMGTDWDAFVDHNLTLARSPKARAAGRLFRAVGLPRIPPEELARITVPTVLIWGRHDRANRLGVAEAASDRYGWPLHVIDDAADDPPRDQPRAFLDVLQQVLD
jgi:pimeloyl-ACP methyl ester carboxylesterase